MALTRRGGAPPRTLRGFGCDATRRAARTPHIWATGVESATSVCLGLDQARLAEQAGFEALGISVRRTVGWLSVPKSP